MVYYNIMELRLILFAAVIGADAAENALKKNSLNGFALITRITIMTVAVFMILSQLGIAEQIVTKAFLIILAALAVAFAVAFGVGGRTYAARLLDRLDGKLTETKDEVTDPKEAEDKVKEDAEVLKAAEDKAKE